MTRADDASVQGDDVVIFPSGASVRPRPGSIADRMLRESANELWAEHLTGDLTGVAAEPPWSLGVVGHLLWHYSPGSRPLILDRVISAFQLATDISEMPSSLSSLDLVYGVYYRSVLRPLLEAFPESSTKLQDELSFLRAAVSYSGSESQIVDYAIVSYAIEWIVAEGYLEHLRLVDEHLYSLIDGRLGRRD